MNDDLNRVKEKIREEFPPEKYELLVNFAAKLFIEGSIMKNEMQDFSNAMFAMKCSIVVDNKKNQNEKEKILRNNKLFKKVIELENHKNMVIRSWKAGKKRHEENKFYKDYVTKDWEKNYRNWETFNDAAVHYQYETEQMLKTARLKRSSYDLDTIESWIKEYATKKGMNVYEDLVLNKI